MPALMPAQHTLWPASRRMCTPTGLKTPAPTAEHGAARAHLVRLDVVLAGVEDLLLAADGELLVPAAAKVRRALVRQVRDAPGPAHGRSAAAALIRRKRRMFLVEIMVCVALQTRSAGC